MIKFPCFFIRAVKHFVKLTTFRPQLFKCLRQSFPLLLLTQTGLPPRLSRGAVLSFGYKYGIPLETDLRIDVRFIPNPYFIPELKNLNGKDEKVKSVAIAEELSLHFRDINGEVTLTHRDIELP